MIVPIEITAKNLLNKISVVQSTRYNHLYYNNIEINKDDIVYDHMIDQNILFVASNKEVPPPRDFYNNFNFFYVKHKKTVFLTSNNSKDDEKNPLNPVIQKILLFIS